MIDDFKHKAHIDVLLKSLERESLAFERRVKDSPFVPSDLLAGFATFKEHCQHIDYLLCQESGCNTLRHVCYMAARESSGGWRAIQYFLPSDNHPAKSLPNVPQSGVTAFLSALLSTGMIPDIGRQGLSSPRIVKASKVLLLCYLVADGGSAPDDYQHVYSFADPKHAAANVLCDVLHIDWSNDDERQRTLAFIRDTASRLTLVFESYHVIWHVPPDAIVATDIDTHVLRALSMQFQREWADQDHLYRKRQALLLSLSHEYKNALRDTDWENLSKALCENTSHSDFESLRGRLIRSLGRMIWPQSLALAIRAFTDAIRGASRLRKEFLDEPEVKSRGADYYGAALKSYEQSIDYLIQYIASVTSGLERYPPRMSRLTPDMNAISSDLASMSVLEQPFDRARLVFPPLNQGEAGRFFLASFVTEPVRNALKYFVKNRISDGILAWGVFQEGESVRFAIANSLRSKSTDPPKMESLDLLREVGETTQIATVGYPAMCFYGERKFVRVHIDFHPHLLRDTIQ